MRPPIHVEAIMRDIDALAADWKVMGYSDQQVGGALAEIAAECARRANELDLVPQQEALRSLRLTMSDALAGRVRKSVQSVRRHWNNTGV